MFVLKEKTMDCIQSCQKKCAPVVNPRQCLKDCGEDCQIYSFSLSSGITPAMKKSLEENGPVKMHQGGMRFCQHHYHKTR